MCMKKGTWQSECVVHDILHEVDAGCGGEVLVVDGGWSSVTVQCLHS